MGVCACMLVCVCMQFLQGQYYVQVIYYNISVIPAQLGLCLGLSGHKLQFGCTFVQLLGTS